MFADVIKFNLNTYVINLQYFVLIFNNCLVHILKNKSKKQLIVLNIILNGSKIIYFGSIMEILSKNEDPIMSFELERDWRNRLKSKNNFTALIQILGDTRF